MWPLQQIFRTETHLAVTMWTGILGMATNNDPAAIAKMVSAYEQIEAAGGNDATLAYFLARAFQDSPEMGSRMWFLRGAISGGIGSAKPEMLLEYADLLTRIRAWAHVQAIAEMYENTMAPAERSIAAQGGGQYRHGKLRACGGNPARDGRQQPQCPRPETGTA